MIFYLPIGCLCALEVDWLPKTKATLSSETLDLDDGLVVILRPLVVSCLLALN